MDGVGARPLICYPGDTVGAELITLICAPPTDRSEGIVPVFNKAGICAGAQGLRLLSVTGFSVSPRPRLAEFTVPD
jgi:hypothetical protein